jgi:hypothetical protein
MTLLATWIDLDPVERRARLRCLQIGVRILVGPAGAGLVAALKAAETDLARLADCDRELAALPTVPARRFLTTFAATLPPST